jgi:lysophospholipase L1-like esterase
MRGVVLNDATGRYEKLNERGCVPAVAQAMHFEIVNKSKFGMTSEKGLRLMAEEAGEDGDADVELIFFGGNDTDYDWPKIAASPEIEHKPYVTLDQFSRNLVEMIGMVRERDAVPILATIPPISGERYFNWFARRIENSANILAWLRDVHAIYRSQELYSDAIIRTAEEQKCLWVDVRAEFLKQRDFLDLLCADGIHPNEKGHRIIEKAFVDFAKAHV